MYTINENPNEESSRSQRARMVETLKSGLVITSLIGLQQYDSLNVKGRIAEIKERHECNLGPDVWIKTSAKKKSVKVYYDLDAINEKYSPKSDEERDSIVRALAFKMLLPYGIKPRI